MELTAEPADEAAEGNGDAKYSAGLQTLSRDLMLVIFSFPLKSEFAELRPMVLVFTSGSTGYSKIVEQMEPGILNNVDALIERHGLGPGSSIATPLPLFHVNALEFAFFLHFVFRRKAGSVGAVVFPMVFTACKPKESAY